MSMSCCVLSLCSIILAMGGVCGGDGELEFEPATSFGGLGTEEGQMNRPMGIVLRRLADPIGTRIFVCDYSNNRVCMWRFGDWSLVRCFGVAGSADGELSGPMNLTVTRSVEDDRSDPPPDSMYVYVADSRNHRIQQFSLEGDFIRTWGSFGTDSGKFNTPTGIDMDFEGNIYVTDSGNHRIQVFDTLGNFIRSWGGRGAEHGQFDSPVDVSVGFNRARPKEFAFVAVSDRGNKRIQLFGRDGTFIRSYDNINDPLGIEVTFRGDYPARRILVVSGESRLLYSLNESQPYVTTERIPVTKGPYDVSSYFVTDSARHVVTGFAWRPE